MSPEHERAITIGPQTRLADAVGRGELMADGGGGAWLRPEARRRWRSRGDGSGNVTTGDNGDSSGDGSCGTARLGRRLGRHGAARAAAARAAACATPRLALPPQSRRQSAMNPVQGK